MSDVLLTHEPLIRASFFVFVLLAVVLWERFAARRPQAIPRGKRWPHNLAIVALDTVAVRLAFPAAAVGAAFVAAEKGWGLLNLIAPPQWLTLLVAVLALDLVIYFQHRLFHSLPWLWRLHRMHHADPEFDVTTALRFHPLEMLLSMGLKIGAVMALGAPPLAVLVFEVLLNATAMFNHGNVRVPPPADRWLRLFVVTPDMHRVHHSVDHRETNSNYGFNLPWWDRLFGTYRDQPAKGHLAMTLGLDTFRTERDQTLYRMLIQPFLSDRKSLHTDRRIPTQTGT